MMRYGTAVIHFSYNFPHVLLYLRRVFKIFNHLYMPSIIQEQVLLAPLTTLGVGGSARYFAEVHDEAELDAVILWAADRKLRILVIGGGSNVLVSDAGFDGLVVHMVGQEVVWREEGEHVYVTAAAGVSLDTLIEESVARNLWGLENLSAIPGTVGATPIQNVGAYGVEVKEVIECVKVYDTHTRSVHEYDVSTCAFGYRTSIFKTDSGKHLIVLAVTFRLSNIRNAKLAYKDLVTYFENIPEPTLREVRTAIIAIRKNKFPDWRELGTAGSFFKNPEIDADTFISLKEKYPELPGYSQENGSVKVSLGWILDRALNLRGFRKGNVGLFEKQALVLVRHGSATAKEIETFSEEIVNDVKEKIGIDVAREVVIVK